MRLEYSDQGTSESMAEVQQFLFFSGYNLLGYNYAYKIIRIIPVNGAMDTYFLVCFGIKTTYIGTVREMTGKIINAWVVLKPLEQ